MAEGQKHVSPGQSVSVAPGPMDRRQQVETTTLKKSVTNSSINTADSTPATANHQNATTRRMIPVPMSARTAFPVQTL